jgi:hypothetical protein
MTKVQMGEIADKVLRKRFFVIIPLAVFAFFGWQFFRLIAIEPMDNHGAQFDNSLGVADIGAQGELCAALKSPRGFLLISGVIEDLPDSGSFGFLQTDEAEKGLFLDFDQVQRVGIPLADGTTSFTYIDQSLDLSSRKDRIVFVILLSSDGTLKYFEDSQFVQVKLSEPVPNCANVQFGMGNESAPFPGKIAVSISSGTDLKVAESLIGIYESHLGATAVMIRLYNVSNFALIVALVLLIFGNPFKKRDSKKVETGDSVI